MSEGAGVSRVDEEREDAGSEVPFFERVPHVEQVSPARPVAAGVRSGAGVSGFGDVTREGVLRQAPAVAKKVGRGPVPVDARKFHYDRVRGRTMPALMFGATRADRLDAEDAGQLMHALHVMFGIDRETEDVLIAFDKALFFEHTINGASLLQEGRGTLSVGTSSFELKLVKAKLGEKQRRFFRAYADEIAEVNAEVIRDFDPYDPESAEKYGQLLAVAVERGLQKHPHLAHDSADAGLRLSVEERVALLNSKRLVLPSVVNNVDKLTPRTPGVPKEGTVASVATQ